MTIQVVFLKSLQMNKYRYVHIIFIDVHIYIYIYIFRMSFCSKRWYAQNFVSSRIKSPYHVRRRCAEPKVHTSKALTAPQVPAWEKPCETTVARSLFKTHAAETGKR